MGPANCAVVGCYNSTRKLNNWKKTVCTESAHENKLKEECGCEQPFVLYMFPSIKRNGDKRNEWIKILRRETSKKKPWAPCGSDRVCSEHFVDKVPTVDNPNPTLKLGYLVENLHVRKPPAKRELVRTAKRKINLSSASTITSCAVNDNEIVLLSPPMSPRSSAVAELLSSPPSLPCIVEFQSPSSDDIYHISNRSQECKNCVEKNDLIASYKKMIQTLTRKNQQLQKAVKKERDLQKLRKPFSSNDIKSDQKMNFYTGITTIKMFKTLFQILQPYTHTITYWQGTKRSATLKQCRKKLKSSKSQRKLNPKDEFLLTLMRIRLNLLNEDLADRFCISTATCSNIFKTWIRFLSETLGTNLVKWLPKESILENMPQVYCEAGHGKVRVIIDCSEVFIERSKSLHTQAVSWSDYKSHNTIKFLIGISPTGYITFLSDCYGGRASDRFICQDSGFYDILDPYDEIMADRGFQIQEELLLKYCTLTVPPGARLKSQMTSNEVRKTKDVANLRIHVERAINRIKTFRILKTVLPITMLHHCDDILRTCAALCNLKPLLFKDSAQAC